MEKTMRKSKLILFLLIVCLALTLCVPALAADTPANYSAGGEAQPAPDIHARCALLCDGFSILICQLGVPLPLSGTTVRSQATTHLKAPCPNSQTLSSKMSNTNWIHS